MKKSIENGGGRKPKQFVGRKLELKLFEEWLSDPEAALRIFAISGMGGIGKSSLMGEMLRTSRERNALGIWLDGRSCTPTPVGFLEYISATIRLETWTLEGSAHPLESLLQAGPKQKVVLCIDNFENVSILEGWLMEVFLPKLPTHGVALLIASRIGLSLSWKTNPFCGGQIKELPLSFLSYEETVDYITSVSPFQRDMAGKMARASDGHPLALALAVEAAVQKKELSGLDKMILSQNISVHVLRELTSPDLQPMVEALTVLKQANQEMLSLVLGQQVMINQYQMLQGMSFVQSGPEGLALHDLARMHLLRDFRLREPERLNSLRAKAANLLNEQLQKADRGKRRMIATQMLWLCKDVFPFHKLYVDLSVDWHVSSLESIHKGDMPILHELLSIWCEYSIDPWQGRLYHDFLDELASTFPESIAVLRDTKGHPIAMAITVLIHSDTSRLLNRYFPAELAECFNPEELLCEPDKADSYYAVLVAATNDFPGYKREELVGLVILDRLSLLGEGARAVCVATDSNLKEFSQKLGFSLRPTVSRNCDTSYARADVLELDFRKKDFGNWIMSFFQEKSVQPHLLPSEELIEKRARKLLSSLRSPAEMQAFVPFFSGIESGIELQKHLLSLLTNETSGLSEHNRRILYLTYFTYANNRIAAGQACSMSKATFYRHLQKAISNLSEILRIQEKWE